MRCTFWVGLLSIGFGLSAGAQTLRFRLSAHPETLDWNRAHTSDETYLLMNMMEGLGALDAQLKPQPRLARRWSVTEGGKRYLFEIRSDVKWSDGVSLTAQHFADSWHRLLKPENRFQSAYLLSDIEGADAFRRGASKNISGIRVVDSTHLEVRLKQPVSHFLHLLTYWATFPIRKDLIDRSPKNWTDAKQLVTLGPYRLVSKTQDTYTLVRAPGQTHGPVRVEATVVPDEKKAKLQFDAGGFDFYLNATTDDLLHLHDQDKISGATSSLFPYLATFYLGFKTDDPVTRSNDLRKAILFSMNREQLPAILKGGQVAAKGWIPPGMEAHGFQIASPFSTFAARAALEKFKAKAKSSLTGVTLWSETFDGSTALTQWICSRLEEVLDLTCKLTPESNRAQLFVRHWGADFADPINFFEVWTSSSGSNYARWKNSTYDQWIASARAEVNSTKRLEHFRSAEALLTEQDAVVLPLFYKKNAVLLGPDIKKFDLSPTNYLFFESIELKEAPSQP